VTHDGERIARLEERADVGEDDLVRMVEKVDDIAKNVNEIKEKLSNWHGFFSGMMFTIAAIAGLIGAGLTAVWHRLFP
jgi:hypothetical protein